MDDKKNKIFDINVEEYIIKLFYNVKNKVEIEKLQDIEENIINALTFI